VETLSMMEFRPKLWVGLGAVVLAGAGLAGCGGEGGEGAQPAATSGAGSVSSGEAAAGESGGEGGAAATAAPAATSGEGGPGGEAGAADAYASVPEISRSALHIAQLSGFLLIAERAASAGDPAGASILIDQGLLEVLLPFPATFGEGRAKAIEPAYSALSAALADNAPAPRIEALQATARKATEDALADAGGQPRDILTGLLSISRGLYSGVVTPQGVDPIEYQHAQGAVLATRAELTRVRTQLESANKARTDQLFTDIDAVLAFFPAPAAPETPASVAEVTSAISRAELTLSGLR
jgi:hypothetical protein